MDQFIFPLKIYIEDTDYGGVVYHANYLKFFERARSEWAQALGMGMDWQQAQKIYFAVRAVKLEYLKPARLNEPVEVVSWVSLLKSASVVFQQQLRLAAATDTILTTAEVTLVCVGHDFRPKPIPPSPLHELRTGEQA